MSNRKTSLQRLEQWSIQYPVEPWTSSLIIELHKQAKVNITVNHLR